ncbi:MAG TPA: YraN family protein [Steroidobacteraceae bacterium]|jgi:putative endonuclease|nr:YraN family protein [Steroidobacteraceae bacterium]
MNTARSRGDAAENLAAAYLTGRGVMILARNVRCRGGEIDLLCLDGALLAVIEVRQRGRLDFGGAAASVTPAKQRRIIRAARHVLQRCADCRGRFMRFDVIGVQGLPDGAHEIAWIKDAFRAT